MNRSKALITPNTVLEYIKMRLGAPYQALEIEDEQIIEVINRQTLPTYSKYYPYFTEHNVNVEEDKVIGRRDRYYLKTELQLLGVSKVLMYGRGGIYGANVLPSYHTNIINDKIYQDMMSMVMQPVTFQFHPPNIVEIFPKNVTVGNFLTELKAVHPSHLSTIPVSMKDEFEKLAYCDVMISLYPIRSRFMSMNTTFGALELFMHDFDRAVEIREDILQRWRENYGKNSNRRKIFVY